MALKFDNSERELLLELKSGNAQAFERLYHLHKRRLTGNLLRLLKSEELVEEVLQELFLKIWEKRDWINEEQPFGAYLYRIAQNLVYDTFRKSARDQKLADHLSANTTELYQHIEENLISREELKRAQKVIDNLSPTCRTVFTLFRIEGKSYKEISEQLGISAPTINEHIQKANKVLRQQLRPSTALITAIASQIVTTF
ncbi:RNA polymerase sigma factor [Pedobacter sp. UBA4863]|uniref:RNA polymerase sigma factor n=1 Tax=Pedobacter sp. UBA4863 TaxID=1947060 RepID=UPI0025FC18E2|nr:RNA polymerase sigma-70 factor [Pedobacter sp. UBA4863]